MRYAVFASTGNGQALAERIAAACQGVRVTVYLQEKLLPEQGAAQGQPEPEQGNGALVFSSEVRYYKRLSEEMADAFVRYDALIFIMAAGIVVRSVAPHVASKLSDPAVLVLDDRGQNIISLLSGHVGGANELTRFLAEKLRSNPVITTATDVNQLLAPDVLAGRLDMVPCPKENLVVFNGALLRGRKLVYLLDSSLKCRAEYERRLRASHVPYEVVDGSELPDRLASTNVTDSGLTGAAGKAEGAGQNALYVVLSDRQWQASSRVLYLVPRRLIAGIGCRRGTPARLVLAALQEACGGLGWQIDRLDRLASTVVKADEQGLLAAAEGLQLPIDFFENQSLEEAIERYGLSESEFVKKNIGVGNVCEAAALCCTERGRIALPKNKYEKVTVALIWER
ncbi:cobalamin biosynthesis protein CbiG [Veillonellaceae bacterium WCA-693-APC-5D-A]|uniref:Cobalamin biosynthesis protein CbiG n=1 Tax=Anaerovibrio slackiae TaxID=2652309 RepID=A0A6I2UJL2_9FIRM|nr:cobalamin biosynthesis protein [Anaerovibrio slackiae]MSU09859.1 cobalamin biosynthesis protein CbiG [Anaerovibrio slackiae]